VRSGQRPAARSIVLIVAAAALCFGVALYFGASRTSAEREHGNHDWPNHGKDLANTRFQDLDQVNPRNVKNLQVGLGLPHRRTRSAVRTGKPRPSRSTAVYSSLTGTTMFRFERCHGKALWKFDGFNDEAQLAGFFLCCGRNKPWCLPSETAKSSSAGLTIPSWLERGNRQTRVAEHGS